jgi:CBS domain containing-hemolysin-like protein
VIAALVVLFLVAVNALYVAAEFAAVGVRTSRVQKEAERGSKLANRLLPYLRDGRALDRYVAACQIGITISSLVVGAYAQAQIAPALAPIFARFGAMQTATAQSTSALVVLVGLTAFQMVLGELVPKSLALQSPLRAALWTVVPMQWSLRLMRWFIHLLNGSGRVILRLLGVRESGHRHVHSPQEISLLIAESGKGGLLKPNEQVRLRHALRLGERPARELMVPRTAIVALDVETPMEEVVRIATESPYTRFPVYENTIDQIIGMAHVRDIATVSTQSGTVGLRDLLRPVLVAPDRLHADEILARLKEERRTMAVLIDEYGGTAGLITVDNILDDLIGDIADEFRPSAATPDRLADGRVRLPGSMNVDDVTPWTGVRWKHRAATVGGLLMERLARIPVPGDSIIIEGVRVEVERMKGRTVASVLITPVRGATAEGTPDA